MLAKHLIQTDTKEAREAREAERAKLGIGKDYKTQVQKARQFDPATMVQDPAYYKEISEEIGIKTSPDWQDF